MPTSRTWCITFEALYQILKKIATNCNYKNILLRICDIWQLRQGLEMIDEISARWFTCKVTLLEEAKSFYYDLDRQLSLLENDGEDSPFMSSPFMTQVRALRSHVTRRTIARYAPRDCTLRAVRSRVT